MSDQNISDLQKKLADELIKKNFIKTKEVEKAFLAVPRHLFLPGVDLEKVYSNNAIVTKWEGQYPISSSSEPGVYGIMLEQLELKEGLKILEIGAGTGFNAALMAQMTGETGNVVTVDIDKDIADSAQNNLNSAGYPNVKVICKDGATGYQPDAPYDRIILTAGAWDINREWFEQLKPGGILVVPIVISIKDQMTIAFKRVEDHLESSSISGCKFMELRGDYTVDANQIEIGQARVMFLISNYISKVNKENNNINSKSPWKEYPTGIKVSILELNRSFLPWLEITQPEFCFLVSPMGGSTTILNMPVIPTLKAKNASMLYGLADKENLCFINLIDEETETKAEDPKLKLYTLNVRNFGSDQNLAKSLVQHIIGWDNAGRPGISNVKVKACFDKSNIVPSTGEYLISKKNADLLFRWER